MSDLEQPNCAPTPAEWRLVALLSALIVAAASLPYLLAYAVPPDYVFGGFLLNPIDGNSYFAKMRQGLRGEWLFRLPYTAEPGAGAFLFTYYLFLGHVARWTGAGLDAIFHLARALGGLVMLLASFAVVARCFESRRARLAVWALYALSSGLGWLALPFGVFTADLWLVEAIPFLTVMANAHFGLATALVFVLVLLIVPGLAAPGLDLGRSALIAFLATLLGLVLPIGLLNVGLVLVGTFSARWFLGRLRSRAGLVRDWAAGALFGLTALPWVAHAAVVTMNHPELAQWNAQNQTPSPPLWNALLAGGVLLLLALPGAVFAFRRRRPLDLALVAWLIFGAVALYLPFALQRRLSMGLWLPLAILAGFGLRHVVLPRLTPRLRLYLSAALAVALLLSNLLLYAAAFGAVAARDSDLFLARGQAAALAWLADNAGRALVAAPPEFGQWVPARSHARVLYGHPFETIQAAAREAELRAFFDGDVPGRDFVRRHGIRYVLVPHAGGASWSPPPDWNWPIIFQQGGTVIYAP